MACLGHHGLRWFRTAVHPTQTAEDLLKNLVVEGFHKEDIVGRDALFRAYLVHDSRLGLGCDHESGG